MYCNVVTAIDKIPTYLLRFNKTYHRRSHCNPDLCPHGKRACDLPPASHLCGTYTGATGAVRGIRRGTSELPRNVPFLLTAPRVLVQI